MTVTSASALHHGGSEKDIEDFDSISNWEDFKLSVEKFVQGFPKNGPENISKCSEQPLIDLLSAEDDDVKFSFLDQVQEKDQANEEEENSLEEFCDSFGKSIDNYSVNNSIGDLLNSDLESEADVESLNDTLNAEEQFIQQDPLPTEFRSRIVVEALLNLSTRLVQDVTFEEVERNLAEFENCEKNLLEELADDIEEKLGGHSLVEALEVMKNAFLVSSFEEVFLLVVRFLKCLEPSLISANLIDLVTLKLEAVDEIEEIRPEEIVKLLFQEKDENRILVLKSLGNFLYKVISVEKLGSEDTTKLCLLFVPLVFPQPELEEEEYLSFSAQVLELVIVYSQLPLYQILRFV